MSTRPSNLSDLSPEYVLLGLLAVQPAHGYGLHLRLTQELGQVWRIHQNQVYNLLKRLEAQGDILGTLQTQDKRPSRCFYELSPAGKRRFETWLVTPTGSSARLIRLEFISRLFFARQTDPQLVGRLVEGQIEATHEGLKRLKSRLAGLPAAQVYNRLGLDLRIRQLEAILPWLEECRQALAPDQAAHV